MPISFLMKHLYQWAAYPDRGARLRRMQGVIDAGAGADANAKRAMLSPVPACRSDLVIFAVSGTFYDPAEQVVAAA